MNDFRTTFVITIKRTPTVSSFRFDDKGGVDFRPGQFFQLFLESEGEELDHYFSFSNSPTEKGYLEFTKRLSESPFSRALRSLKPGDPVRMNLPLGEFTFEGEHPRVAFLSGGIGITPIRSICKYLTDTRSPADARLLYSARSEEDIVFREDFIRMEKENPHLSVTYSITDGDPPPDWKGRVGRISASMVAEEIPDYSGRVFFVCGPPGMVKGMIEMLKGELGMAPERVIRENFTGY